MRWTGAVVVAGTLCVALRLSAGMLPATLLFDAVSGHVLQAQDPDRICEAGALYQMMVVLLTLEQADLGSLRLDVPITISASVAKPAEKQARKRTATRNGFLPLQQNRTYLLSDLLKAVLVTGSDEAALAVAEAISGSAENALEAMNERASRLGLASTRFETLDSHPRAGCNVTTARDTARLAHVVLGHRLVTEWASLSGIPFDDGSVLLRNVNPLVGRIPGVDGLLLGDRALQTGRDAAFDAVISASRGSLRLGAIVLGETKSENRFRTAVDLLEWGFAHYEQVDVIKEGERLNFAVDVDGSAGNVVHPVAAATASLLRRKGVESTFEVRYQLPSSVTAPIDHGQPMGEVIVEEGGQILAVVPAISPVSVPLAAGVITASSN